MFPQNFNDPGGYYIVWERCCRNNIITNIIQPEATGQTFYMEFPPVFLGGSNFNNNSPAFSITKSDYPCLNENFELSFRAVDPDGDELRYSLVNPLKGNSTVIVPRGTPPIPAPYDPVSWRTGFSATNPLKGNPGLQVNPTTGLVTCRATQVGLFVFSVKCEEWRAGRKIGEVRREMQITVVDCPFNSKPEIVIRQENSIPPLANEDTLYITGGFNQTCQPLALVDRQRNESVSYRLVRISGNAPASLETLKTLFIGSGSDSAASSFCVPSCSFSTPEQPWRVLFVATDNGCSLPKTDSLYLNLVVRPGPTNPPLIETVVPQPDTLEISQTVALNIPIRAKQSQGGDLVIRSTLTDGAGNTVTGNNLKLPSGNGMGQVNTSFGWREICISPENNLIRMESVVESVVCGETKYDTLTLFYRVIPKSLDIRIESSYPGNPSIVLNEKESVGFTLTGEVTENRPIQLNAKGPLKTEPGFSFRGGFANGQVSDYFSYSAICSGRSGVFPVRFLVSSVFCGYEYKDSLDYTVTLVYESDSTGPIPNLITANGDGHNDYFSLERIAPKDNCANEFDFVEIYNRWGKRVFYSKDRSFQWKPDGQMEGVYFFGLNFIKKRFSGWIAVVR
jgi:hypothetical protein